MRAKGSLRGLGKNRLRGKRKTKPRKQEIVHRLCKKSKDDILGGTVWVGTQNCRRRAANHRARDDKLRAYASRRSQ
jgi:hypothetical protein